MAWEAVGCENLQDYLEFYLFLDVVLLAEVMQNFRNEMYGQFGIDPARMITGPSLALSSAMYSAVKFANANPAMEMPTEVQLIDDPEIFITIKGGVRGGFVTMVRTKTELNDPNLPGYDSGKTKTTAGMVDVNSLYPTIMAKKLPTGKPEILTEEEMQEFMEKFNYVTNNRDDILREFFIMTF